MAQRVERQRNAFGGSADQGQGLIRKDFGTAATDDFQPMVDVLPGFIFS